ncbi:MAG: hypothetical protein P4M00_09430 [Azospirillaceae bacterium]|nr:hypothetical protein [Azospirillaceae bacterium]
MRNGSGSPRCRNDGLRANPTTSGWIASGLVPAIPHARYHTMPDATPFSAFSLCTAQATTLLHDEGEDEIRAQLGAMIDTALQRAFSPPP